MNGKNKKIVPKLLVTIVDRDRVDTVIQVFVKTGAVLHTMFLGEGTAPSEMLDMLGVGASAKMVIICIERSDKIPRLLKAVTKKVNLSRTGAGIAFSIPLTALGGLAANILCRDAQPKYLNEGADEMDNTKKEIKNDLILTLINRGFSEELMSAARKAGAAGGTVIHARHINEGDNNRFYGIALQEEKEVVAILTPRTKKADIMRAVNEAAGLKTEAKGVVLSLPVESIAGIDFEDEA